MIRRLPVLCLLLFTAACASTLPPQAPAAHRQGPARPPRDQLRDYLGMTAAALRQKMGTPAFVRKDGVAELWRYDGSACRAFFFLYDAPAGKETNQVVRSVDTLPQGPGGGADMGCLAALKLSPAKTS
jgi:hypothetical protein